MKKTLKFAAVFVPALLLLLLTSCAKPTHQVYFKVTGVSNSTQIDYAIYSDNGLLASTLESADTTETVLPWTTETMTVSEGQVGNIIVTIDDTTTLSPYVTVMIYSDGSIVKSASCSGNYSSASARITF